MLYLLLCVALSSHSVVYSRCQMSGDERATGVFIIVAYTWGEKKIKYLPCILRK